MTIDNESSEIIGVSSFLELAEALGFVETPEMQRLRAAITESIRMETDHMPYYQGYEEAAKKAGLLAKPEGQVAMIIMKAIIYQESGDNEAFLEEIEAAIQYASGASISFPEIFNDIEEAILRLVS